MLPVTELWLFAFRLLLPITELRCWMVCDMGLGFKGRGDGVKDRAGRIWERNELISLELIESWISLSVNWQ